MAGKPAAASIVALKRASLRVMGMSFLAEERRDYR
jgi:hypothetical protein